MTDDSPIIVWREIFAVGHPGLDAEHIFLLNAINEIYFAERALLGDDDLKSMLNALLDAIEKHLKHENFVMRKVSEDASVSASGKLAYLKAMSDGVIEEHILEHSLELAELRSIIGAVCPGRVRAGEKISFQLKDWFLNHAIKYDAHLKAVFQAM